MLPVPTALGVKAALFYGLLVGAFFAAPYSNLYFLLLVFLTVLGGLNVLWAVRNLAGATAEAEPPAPVPAGVPVPWRVRVDAAGRPRYAVSVELRVEGRGRVSASASLARGETELTGTIDPLPRGVYPVGWARLVSAWPLGLLRARRPASCFEEIVVYPAPAALPESREGGGGLGDLLGPWGVSEGLLQPSGVREYLPGDELRRVHWKASARRGELVVTEWEGGIGAGVEVVLDRRVDEDRLEEALSLLSALCLAARAEKELVTLHTQGLSATFGSGKRPFAELLRFLAGTTALPPSAPAPPPASTGVLRLPAPAESGGGR